MKLLNPKAKITFLIFNFYFFDRNQPMTQPSAGNKTRHFRFGGFGLLWIQKAKVTFFIIFFDRNQPMTQPSAGKNEIS